MMQDQNMEILKADKPIICGEIEWMLLPSRRHIKHSSHPDTGRLWWEWKNGEFARIRAKQGETAESLGLLPHGWTDRDFYMAWSFWAAGHRKGYAEGGYYERSHFMPSWRRCCHYYMRRLWLRICML